MLAIQRVLQGKEGQGLAIYGLGVQTQRLLEEIGRQRVMCLLDGCRTDGALYGVKIMEVGEAVKAGVRVIIAAARPESCKVIAKRIGGLCREKGVALLDTEGQDLLAVKSARFDFPTDGGVTEKQILEAIDGADCVSMDMFDTLVARRTLFPADVFDIVDLRLRERGIAIPNFAARRRDAERELAGCREPKLWEIYDYMLEGLGGSGADPELLAGLEWETDWELALPRREVCGLLEKARAKGKPIYIVSDTFYTRDQLAKLLEKCGVTGYTEILASCEYGTGKTGRLFEELKKKLHGGSCVHIGDSQAADIEGAQKAGIRALRVRSALELFEKTGYLGLWENINSLPERIQAGMLAARLFNSPFAGESGLSLNTAGDVGYVLFAPVITAFVLWLKDRVQKDNIGTVWFSARDGYLIKKLYDELTGTEDSVYFLTSRTAAIRAGMQTEADIRYVEEMRFGGSIRQLLKKRFNVDIDGEISPNLGLLAFKKEILEKAETARKGYSAYLDTLPNAAGDIALFDFVARGTVQMFTQRLLDVRLKGFYFMQQDPELMGGLDVTGFADRNSPVAKNYYVLETVMTSPDPSVEGYSENGEPLYASETRSPENIACVERVQKGIEEYFREYIRLAPLPTLGGTAELPGRILELTHKLEITAGDFLDLKVEDPFYNRTTVLTDLI